MLPPLNFRLRMMLLLCFVVGVLMAITCATVYSIFAKTIQAELDLALVHAAKPTMADLSADPQKDDISELNLQDQMLLVFDQSGRLLNRSKNVDPGMNARIGPLPESRSVVFRSLDGPHGSVTAALIPCATDHRFLWFVISHPTTALHDSESRICD